MPRINLTVEELKELLVRDMDTSDMGTESWTSKLSLARDIIAEASDDPVNLHEFDAEAIRFVKKNSLTTTMALKLFNLLRENGIPTHDDEVMDSVYQFTESVVDKADTM